MMQESTWKVFSRHENLNEFNDGHGADLLLTHGNKLKFSFPETGPLEIDQESIFSYI